MDDSSLKKKYLYIFIQVFIYSFFVALYFLLFFNAVLSV